MSAPAAAAASQPATRATTRAAAAALMVAAAATDAPKKVHHACHECEMECTAEPGTCTCRFTVISDCKSCVHCLECVVAMDRERLWRPKAASAPRIVVPPCGINGFRPPKTSPGPSGGYSGQRKRPQSDPCKPDCACTRHSPPDYEQVQCVDYVRQYGTEPSKKARGDNETYVVLCDMSMNRVFTVAVLDLPDGGLYDLEMFVRNTQSTEASKADWQAYYDELMECETTGTMQAMDIDRTTRTIVFQATFIKMNK